MTDSFLPPSLPSSLPSQHDLTLIHWGIIKALRNIPAAAGGVCSPEGLFIASSIIIISFLTDDWKETAPSLMMMTMRRSWFCRLPRFSSSLLLSQRIQTVQEKEGKPPPPQINMGELGGKEKSTSQVEKKPSQACLQRKKTNELSWTHDAFPVDKVRWRAGEDSEDKGLFESCLVSLAVQH